MEQKKKIHISPDELWTIPNILTYFRFLLIPVFITLYLYGFYVCEDRSLSQKLFEWFGVGTVILASLTDFVDGKIARKYNLITELGKTIDPLADKMMQLSIAIVVGITYYHYTSNFLMWILLSIFVVKELTQFTMIYITYRHGQYMNGAKWYGKISTFVFDVLMIACLCMPLFFDVTANEKYYNGWISAFVILVSVVLVFAWVMYIIECIKLWKSGINNIPDSKAVKDEKKNSDTKEDKKND